MGGQRGHAFVDIPTFRRCLCYTFGEQWTLLGMTTPEFVEAYSPYISREQSTCGDALINWKAWATDISNKAGVRVGNLGYTLVRRTRYSCRTHASLHRELPLCVRSTSTSTLFRGERSPTDP